MLLNLLFSLFLHFLHGGHLRCSYSLLLDFHFMLMNLLLVHLFLALDLHLLLSHLDFHHLLIGGNIVLLDGNTFFFLFNLLVRFFIGSCVSLSFWDGLNFNLVSLSDRAHVVSVQSSQELIVFSLVGHLLLESSGFGNGSLIEGLLLAHVVVLDLAEDFIDLVLLILWHDVLGEFVVSWLWSMHILRFLLDFSLIIFVILVGVGNNETSLVFKSSDKVGESKNLGLIFWSVLKNLG
jgi:hypothetical protein